MKMEIRWQVEGAGGDIWPERNELTAKLRNCTMESFMLCTPHQTLFR
jgi:hypothetical protein